MDWGVFEIWLQSAPPVVIGATLLASVLVLVVAGRLAQRIWRSPPGEETDLFLTQSVLGLLALLMSFTFALATDRFETRRILVQQEANAIRSAYLDATMLQEPYRTRVLSTLVSYTENRIALATATGANTVPLLRVNDQLLRQLWRHTSDAFPQIENTDFASAFLSASTEVLNFDATRKSARLARVPTGVFALLFVYLMVTGAVLGFTGKTLFAPGYSALFLTLLALLMVLVLDIDRPMGGGVRESQGPMERLRADMVATRMEGP